MLVSSFPLKLDICKQGIESDYTKRDIAEGSARYVIIINTQKRYNFSKYTFANIIPQNGTCTTWSPWPFKGRLRLLSHFNQVVPFKYQLVVLFINFKKIRVRVFPVSTAVHDHDVIYMIELGPCGISCICAKPLINGHTPTSPEGLEV